MKQVAHIFWKDVRLFWIEILATLSVTALFAWLYPMSWGDSPTIAAQFFEVLEEAGMPPGVVNVCPGSGATFDVTALYRFIAVQEWLAREGLSVENMLEYVRAIERKFIDALTGQSVTRAMLVVPDEARRGRFLAARAGQ